MCHLNGRGSWAVGRKIKQWNNLWIIQEICIHRSVYHFIFHDEHLDILLVVSLFGFGLVCVLFCSCHVLHGFLAHKYSALFKATLLTRRLRCSRSCKAESWSTKEAGHSRQGSGCVITEVADGPGSSPPLVMMSPSLSASHQPHLQRVSVSTPAQAIG